MKSRYIYFLLWVGAIASISFFALKLHEYYQSHSNFAYNGLPYSSNQQQLQKEFRYKSKLDIRNISYYENLFKGKNLFKILGKKKAPLPQKKTEAKVDLEKELSKFELLGIVSSGGKSQALIRNMESGKTFYCTGNEKLNGFIIKEVLDNKVILKRGDWIAELKL